MLNVSNPANYQDGIVRENLGFVPARASSNQLSDKNAFTNEPIFSFL
jgi:hypothetical protein